MISNFKQHFRGVTTSIVAPPVLLLAKVSARRAKYKENAQKLSLLFLRTESSAKCKAREIRVKAKDERRLIATVIHYIMLLP